MAKKSGEQVTDRVEILKNAPEIATRVRKGNRTTAGIKPETIDSVIAAFASVDKTGAALTVEQTATLLGVPKPGPEQNINSWTYSLRREVARAHAKTQTKTLEFGYRNIQKGTFYPTPETRINIQVVDWEQPENVPVGQRAETGEIPA